MNKYILIILLLFSTNALANDMEKVAKSYVKEVAKQYINFDDPLIKYGGGTVGAIYKKELSFKMDNTKVNIDEDNINLTWKWSF